MQKKIDLLFPIILIQLFINWIMEKQKVTKISDSYLYIQYITYYISLIDLSI